MWSLFDSEVGEKKPDIECIYEKSNDRWEYAVCIAPKEEFTQVSFVNGIYTGKGGKHVDYLLNQIIRKLVTYIKKKKKIDVKTSTIKEQLIGIVRNFIDSEYEQTMKNKTKNGLIKFKTILSQKDLGRKNTQYSKFDKNEFNNIHNSLETNNDFEL